MRGKGDLEGGRASNNCNNESQISLGVTFKNQVNMEETQFKKLKDKTRDLPLLRQVSSY